MAQGSAGLNLGAFSLPPQKDARAHEKQALSLTHPRTREGPRPIVYFAVDEHGGSILGDPVHFHRHGEAGLNGRFCRGKARVSSATCLWVTAQLTLGQFTQTHIWLLSFPAQTLLKTLRENKNCFLLLGLQNSLIFWSQTPLKNKNKGPGR